MQGQYRTCVENTVVPTLVALLSLNAYESLKETTKVNIQTKGLVVFSPFITISLDSNWRIHIIHILR